jgi:MFS family permease
MHGLAFLALYCLCGISMGWLADRFDRRILISAGLLFWSVMTAACGFASSFSQFFIARVGVGLGEAILVPAGMSLLSSAVDKDKMARSVAIFLMEAALGDAIALLGGGFLLNRPSAENPLRRVFAPWQVLFMIAADPGFVLAIVFARIREPRRAASRDQPGQSWTGLFEALKHLQAFEGLRVPDRSDCVQHHSCSGPKCLGAPPLCEEVRPLSRRQRDFRRDDAIGQWAGEVLIDRLFVRGVTASSHLILALCALAAVPPAFLFLFE